jgi:hypothetical protein
MHTLYSVTSASNNTRFGAFNVPDLEDKIGQGNVRFIPLGIDFIRFWPANMFITFLKKPTTVLFLASVLSLAVSAQVVGSPAYNGRGAAGEDIPVLIKHLPDWESVREKATYAKNVPELRGALGDRPVLDLIDFSAGTEAVTAPYDAGTLLIIEYSTPQGSIEADAAFTAKLSSDGDATTVYRRIGNYNAFVFDAADQAAADALLAQVKYEKVVQWLGRNPYIISAERAFVLTTSDIFLSTFLAIVGGLGFAILAGVISGYVFFSIREYKRSSMPTFSDAGGMTRLNLDGFTPDITPKRLLKD